MSWFQGTRRAWDGRASAAHRVASRRGWGGDRCGSSGWPALTYSQTKVPAGMSWRDRTPQPMFSVR